MSLLLNPYREFMLKKVLNSGKSQNQDRWFHSCQQDRFCNFLDQPIFPSPSMFLRKTDFINLTRDCVQLAIFSYFDFVKYFLWKIFVANWHNIYEKYAYVTKAMQAWTWIFPWKHLSLYMWSSINCSAFHLVLPKIPPNNFIEKFLIFM